MTVCEVRAFREVIKLKQTVRWGTTKLNVKFKLGSGYCAHKEEIWTHKVTPGMRAHIQKGHVRPQLAEQSTAPEREASGDTKLANTSILDF